MNAAGLLLAITYSAFYGCFSEQSRTPNLLGNTIWAKDPNMSWSLSRRPLAAKRSISHLSCIMASFSTSASNVLVVTDALSSKLQDPTLLTDWKPNSTATTFAVTNPASPDTVLAELPSFSQEQVRHVVDDSYRALPSWRDGTTGAFRGNLLTQWSSLMKENSEDLAVLMTLESGKPLHESRGEVNYAASFLDYYAAEAIRPSGAGGGFMVPTPFAHPPSEESGPAPPRGRIMAVQQAVGLTAMITPWNFPLAMITRKCGPALAAGCTAVVKPSELTPLSAIALQTLATRAGVPPHVVDLVTSSTADTPAVGTELATNSQIRKLSFTGSTRVGKWLMATGSENVKRMSLELGGNAPFIVFEDADIDQAVTAAIASKFRNAGQTCVCADRFLIHAKVHDEFVEKLLAHVQKFKVGPSIPGGEAVDVGPLISPRAVETVEQKVNQAGSDGANCLVGGKRRDDLGSHFYAPTILTNVDPQSDIWKTETFGPVVAIAAPFQTEEEALALANDSSAGLSAYMCTKDLSRTFRVSTGIEAGMVAVNDGILSTATAPFGGIKESGLGREGSHLGISEYMETKYVLMNV